VAASVSSAVTHSVQDMGTAGRGQTVATRLKGTSPTKQERSGEGRTDLRFAIPSNLTRILSNLRTELQLVRYRYTVRETDLSGDGVCVGICYFVDTQEAIRHLLLRGHTGSH
jgi:hypothetical protein